MLGLKGRGVTKLVVTPEVGKLPSVEVTEWATDTHELKEPKVYTLVETTLQEAP